MKAFLNLLSSEEAHMLVKPFTIVLTHPACDKTLWTLSTLRGSLKALEWPPFNFSELTTIVVGEDLYTFKASRCDEMIVTKYEQGRKADEE